MGSGQINFWKNVHLNGNTHRLFPPKCPRDRLKAPTIHSLWQYCLATLTASTLYSSPDTAGGKSLDNIYSCQYWFQEVTAGSLYIHPPLHMPFKVRSLLPAVGGGRSVAEEWWRGEYWLQDDKRVRGIHPTVQSLPDLDSSWLYSQFLCHSALHSLWTITATAGFTAYRSLFILHITWDYAAFQQFWHSDLLCSLLL